MNFEMNFSDDHTLIWKIPRCFAYEGVKRLGFIDKYECGIVERIYGWMEELGVEYSISPRPKGCNRIDFGKCEMELKFQIKGEKI